MKKYRININGISYEVEVEEMGEVQTPSPANTQPNVQNTANLSPAPQPSQSNGPSEAINAPMPGTIVDIKVREGEAVKSGQVIMVLEAMKMENEIVAPKDGKVIAIKAAKGASVSSGEALLDIA